MSRSVSLWVGARGAEFDWRHVRSCAEANVALLQHAASAALVWLCARRDLPRALAPPVLALAALTPYRALLEDAAAALLALAAWPLLALRALHAAALALVTLAFYAIMAQQTSV